jgi:lysophospholipase L1-like esterase
MAGVTGRFERYVAIGDSSTEGLEDPDGSGGYRGWANRLAERIARTQGEGSLHYANLGVRGKQSGEIRNEQLAAALAMKPDLATVFAGSNDILVRNFDPNGLRHNLETIFGSLTAQGAIVITFTLPDLTGVMPIGRFLQQRVRQMNATIRDAAAATGARWVDFEAIPVASDLRLWAEDRFHVNAEGHARICAALAQCLGLPDTNDAWRQPLPADTTLSRWTRFRQDCRWFGRHLLPRFRPGDDAGMPLRAKRPKLTPFRVTRD